MSKLEKHLSEDRKAKVLAARRRILEIEEQAKYAGPTNDNGAPIVVSYGITVEDLLKSLFKKYHFSLMATTKEANTDSKFGDERDLGVLTNLYRYRFNFRP